MYRRPMAVISSPGFALPLHPRQASSSDAASRLVWSQLRHQRQPSVPPVSVPKPLAFTSTSTSPLVVKHRRGVTAQASNTGAIQPASPDNAANSDSPVARFKAMLSPFSEPSTNKKLLALCGAQALSSVATLIHDTYLPLYLSEELKLSNTKASQ